MWVFSAYYSCLLDDRMPSNVCYSFATSCSYDLVRSHGFKTNLQKLSEGNQWFMKLLTVDFLFFLLVLSAGYSYLCIELLTDSIWQ
jgi:hypothetical protein